MNKSDMKIIAIEFVQDLNKLRVQTHNNSFITLPLPLWLKREDLIAMDNLLEELPDYAVFAIQNEVYKGEDEI